MKPINKLLLSMVLLTISNAGFSMVSLFDLRDTRYCEIIAIQDSFGKLTAKVYNTTKLDTCPAEKWNKITKDEVRRQFHVSLVKLNGPRYWTIDGLEASGDTVNSQTITVGGIRLKERAVISSYIWNGTVGSKLYTPNKVHRHTVWIYEPHKKIYELISPSGDAYVMQSYAQIIDKDLTIKDLDNLGKHLKLPKGWKYQTRILDKELRLEANGIAYVINDNLYNSYQREF